ncbi:MAG: hypothetical protein LC635_05480 [Pseudonocardiaceae bacterium]|nr:hypothetical protein [Pseudonocardiaceae bacterium]
MSHPDGTETTPPQKTATTDDILAELYRDMRAAIELAAGLAQRNRR